MTLLTCYFGHAAYFSEINIALLYLVIYLALVSHISEAMKATAEGGGGGGLITFSEKVGSKENQKRKGSYVWRAYCYF